MKLKVGGISRTSDLLPIWPREGRKLWVEPSEPPKQPDPGQPRRREPESLRQLRDFPPS